MIEITISSDQNTAAVDGKEYVFVESNSVQDCYDRCALRNKKICQHIPCFTQQHGLSRHDLKCGIFELKQE